MKQNSSDLELKKKTVDECYVRQKKTKDVLLTLIHVEMITYFINKLFKIISIICYNLRFFRKNIPTVLWSF